MLAAKTSLCARVDALGEEVKPTLGIDSRAKVEERLRECEQVKVGEASLSSFSSPFHYATLLCQLHKISGTGKAMARAEKYELKG